MTNSHLSMADLRLSTRLIFSILAAVLTVAASLVLLSSPARASVDEPETDYELHLLCGTGYWGSYQNYLDRQLLVDYRISNAGAGPAYNVLLTEATASSGVTLVSSLPLLVDSRLDPAEEATITLRWQVPAGITSFRTKLTACASCGPHEVAIDIKYGSFPNSINIKRKGNVPVTVFGDSGFNIQDIDFSSVRFAGGAALAIGQSYEDVNGDGLLDTVYHFDQQSLDLHGSDTEACLSGSTTQGLVFEGCDSVRVLHG